MGSGHASIPCKTGRVFVPGAAGSGFDYGQNVLTSRNTLRGTGKALSIHMESSDGKDMHIYGWAIPYAVETVS